VKFELTGAASEIKIIATTKIVFKFMKQTGYWGSWDPKSCSFRHILLPKVWTDRGS